MVYQGTIIKFVAENALFFQSVPYKSDGSAAWASPLQQLPTTDGQTAHLSTQPPPCSSPSAFPLHLPAYPPPPPCPPSSNPSLYFPPCVILFYLRIMAGCGRSLDSPCTLALLVGFQFAFVLYFSLGGFRGLVSVLVHTTEPEFDYSRPHDVYTNLSHLGVPPPPPRNSGTGPPPTGPPLKDCQIPSPLLGKSQCT